MPRKQKGLLPSGNVRVQIYDHTDENGKKHYKSFTAPTRKEAQALAELYKQDRSKKKDTTSARMSVHEMVEAYISSKESVLSPATIRGYDSILRIHLSNGFGDFNISELTNPIIQAWISELSTDRKPKTVANVFALFSSALSMYLPDFKIRVTLPAKNKTELYCPNDNDIKKLLAYVAGTELERAVLLATFGPLRRGEIAALTSEDIEGNVVTVRRDMVKDRYSQWITKTPKTYDSYRSVTMPGFVIEKFKGMNGELFLMNPDQITRQFQLALLRLNLPHFRFHDLRHYSVSIMHAIGVPDQYIQSRGGWRSNHIMNSVYRNTIDLEKIKQEEKINSHFESLTVQ